MSSSQEKKLFPSFSNNKESPTKKIISLKTTFTGKNIGGGLKQFYQTKVLKGIKLSNLNEVNSIHSSVYQSNNDGSLQQNSLRNIVNSSYWNSTQQSIVQVFGQNQSKISASKANDESLLRREVKIRESSKELNLQSSRKKQGGFKIRSMSQSHLSGNNFRMSQVSNKRAIFGLTNIHNSQARNVSNNQQMLPSINPSFYESMQSLKQQRDKEQQLSKLPVPEQVEKLFSSHFERSFIKGLIEFMNKDWSQSESNLLEDRKIQMLLNIMSSKFASFAQLINDFLSSQFVTDYSSALQKVSNYSLRETKLLCSILFKQCQQTFVDMKKLFEELIGKLPQEGIIQQQRQLDELRKTILEIYDPKFAYSQAKIKERFQLYYEVYCIKRNSLETEIKHKLKPQLTFIKLTENYLSSYQKELIKLKTQITNLQNQKQHLVQLLKEKTTFKPIQIDFNKLATLKQQASQKIKDDFENNVVKFHNKIHQKNAVIIQELTSQNKRMKNEVIEKERQKQYHMNKLEEYLRSIPTKKDQSTQIFNIPTSNNLQTSMNNSQKALSPFQPAIYSLFLQNITTPFTFNEKITSSLISILTIDKILYDYEPIRSKLPLAPFRHYIYEWFIIRTGSKKIAQIFLKNFLYSVKKYRNKHKRFNIFNKICGYVQLRGRNLQQDIQHLFYQSNLAWYYIVKIALIYRKKLNENPTGYHFFPPIDCQEIFKLSLRKTYELIQNFFIQEQIPIPENLNQKMDHYAINQISKFKQNDEEFQKQSLQEIHILRQLNFDIIVGFILDYVASQKAVTLQALFRSIHLKQEEDKHPIGYGQFEGYYKKYFKQKRSKIEFIYAKFCMCNMQDVLNAQNMSRVIMLCIEDQAPLRLIFEKHQSLKSLILSEKQSISLSIKNDKKTIVNPNSYDFFKERFYLEFYDFYDMTIMLEEIFKITRSLVRKKLKKIINQQNYIEKLLEIPKGPIVGKNEQKKITQSEEDDQQDDNYQSSDDQKIQKIPNDAKSLQMLTGQRTYLQQKLQEWKKIQERIPHFATKILTIEQIIIHNMRRKEMFEGCQFAWRTLREILVSISK